MTGLAIEAATGHVEVAALDPAGGTLACEVEAVGHGHTRRLVPMVARALAAARLEAAALRWVAADLGPGSFTGVRVGLATAQALAMAARAELRGASSLAALAHGAGLRRALIVPLVEAGRRDVYAGFFRGDHRGAVSLLAAPIVGPAAQVLDTVREAHALIPTSQVRFIGPGVPRERALLEQAFPGATDPAVRHEGLSALDLALAAGSGLGPAAGLPAPGAAIEPLYVRPAQAEERVRREAHARIPTTLREFAPSDIPAVTAIERAVFSDPWPASFFAGELESSQVYARIAERDGAIAGYSVAWLGEASGHLGNLAVAPGLRRRGVARVLIEDLIERARAAGATRLTLEVRVSNFAAQWLYKSHGFRMAGLRRRYYRDTGEDALILMWKDPASRHS